MLDRVRRWLRRNRQERKDVQLQGERKQLSTPKPQHLPGSVMSGAAGRVPVSSQPANQPPGMQSSTPALEARPASLPQPTKLVPVVLTPAKPAEARPPAIPRPTTQGPSVPVSTPASEVRPVSFPQPTKRAPVVLKPTKPAEARPPAIPRPATQGPSAPVTPHPSKTQISTQQQPSIQTHTLQRPSVTPTDQPAPESEPCPHGYRRREYCFACDPDGYRYNFGDWSTD